MDKKQLIKLIKETLIELKLYTPEALQLVLGTIAQESALGKYIEQIKGPAKGICQMEPATYDDIWDNYLFYKPSLSDAILKLCVTGDEAEEMTWNLKLSIAMCRVYYLRDKEPIPHDLVGQAAYWKRVYNTSKGRGTIEQYINNYHKYIG